MSARKLSWVWSFFTKCSDGKQVTCSICGAVLSFHHSTSSLSTHLKQVHKKEPIRGGGITPDTNIDATSGECVETQASTSGGRKRKKHDTVHDCTFERQELISRGVARLIASNMFPISFVSSEGFRDFMKLLEPGYKVPSQQSILSRLQLFYNDVREKIANDLAEVESASISVDEWTSRTQDCFLSVEAQYIDKNSELWKVTLCNEQIEDRPNVENIASAIEVVLADWNISDKTQAITHDSASVMNAAAQQLFNIGDSIKCSAHLLQLVIKDALAAVPDYDKICKKGRNLTAHFHRSNIAKTALVNRQVQLGIKENRLIQCCETRWSSKYYMCERLLLNRNAICLVFQIKPLQKLAMR
ncbi:zinc finger BED domain-containing protein DAYSLEEPER-like [Rhagoletis pomonella]|uniref:zinc finger BED domain-containing protein DAYSLEEPER-like n=2 Tax=Rhagoletis pomonella TaxID=28610 RepID=UPI0017805AAC|nr:zinc finger BED domain-containing protein DAYSLEEPER-like [Rhagoletis pomonella]